MDSLDGFVVSVGSEPSSYRQLDEMGSSLKDCGKSENVAVTVKVEEIVGNSLNASDSSLESKYRLPTKSESPPVYDQGSNETTHRVHSYDNFDRLTDNQLQWF